jgi:glycosyltransferase involved in cell wall biosynthesis
MIKVCHIITKLELGGAQQNTLYTVKSLDRRRFVPLLITGSEGVLVEEAKLYHDVKQYYLPELVREIRPIKDLVAFYKIWQILRREKRATPQMSLIVHTHSSKAGILGRWAAQFAGVSCIIHSIHGFGFHEYQSTLMRYLFISLEWLTSKITTHFIAVASANIEAGTRVGLFSQSQVSLIRSGIDLARFQDLCEYPASKIQDIREKILQELRISPHKKIVGMIACFKPQKAPLDFVGAMKMVADIHPDVHAIMIGDGVLRPQIETMIARYHLENVISLLGWRTDIPELLRMCQVLVLTSLWEGLPRVCPQAMAVGIPIVATNIDGIPEAVHDGVNGFLVQPGNIQEIAEKISYLLSNPEIAKNMGIQGQKYVQEFDIQRMVQQQEALYHSLVSELK